jgi:heme exporter protein C
MRIASNILGGLGLIAMVAALYTALLAAPIDAVQGVVQKVFYFHVPSAWVAFLAFLVVFIFSILFLWTGNRRFDVIAHSSAEVGVLFTTLVLLTGPLWAKPIWGVWWPWDPRLTTTAILWLIYVAYLMVRTYAREPGQGERFAAVLGIVGFFDVPVVYLAVRWWRTVHPQQIILTSSGPQMPFSMLYPLFISLTAFTLLYVFLLLQRASLRQLEDEVQALKFSQGR